MKIEQYVFINNLFHPEDALNLFERLLLLVEQEHTHDSET